MRFSAKSVKMMINRFFMEDLPLSICRDRGQTGLDLNPMKQTLGTSNLAKVSCSKMVVVSFTDLVPEVLDFPKFSLKVSKMI